MALAQGERLVRVAAAPICGRCPRVRRGPLRQSPACRHVAILRTETRTVPIVWDVVATAELKRTPNARVDCSKTHDRQALEPDKSRSQMPSSRSFGDVFDAPSPTSADTHGYRESTGEVSSRVKFPASTAWRSRLSMDAGLLRTPAPLLVLRAGAAIGTYQRRQGGVRRWGGGELL